MEVERVLHMVGGAGQTSYATNSLLQEQAITKAKPMVEEAVKDLLYLAVLPAADKMAVVDLGCSSGPNTFLVISEIINVVRETCRRLSRSPPEIQFFLDDLPGNDFNNIFRSLAPFQKKLVAQENGGDIVPFYVSGVPGSIYGRLFPKDSIHFAHSSYCLHFLSKIPKGVESETGIPLNKGNIYMTKTTPPSVIDAYLEQFKSDFSLFLKLRSEEMTSRGRMVLTFLGRSNVDPSIGECCYLWGLLAEALNDMVSEGLVKEAKLDSFNLPFYTPSTEELRAVIHSEGSFDLIHEEIFELNWDPMDDFYNDFVLDNLTSGQNVAKCIRAVIESVIADHFGEAIIEELFSRYAENVARHLVKQKTKYVNLSVSLKKRG